MFGGNFENLIHKKITISIAIIATFLIISQVNVSLDSYSKNHQTINAFTPSVDFNSWIDQCDSIDGWTKQTPSTGFSTPREIISEGDLVLDSTYPYALYFDGLPDLDRNNTGPLYVKDLGFSIPILDAGLLWARMSYEEYPWSAGGMSLLLFDTDRDILASFSIVDDRLYGTASGRICYFQKGSTLPFTSHNYETNYYQSIYDFSLFYVAGSGDLASVIDVSSRSSQVLVEQGDYDSSRQIRYIGIQGHCIRNYIDTGEYYFLDEIELTYEVHSPSSDPTPSTSPDSTTPTTSLSTNPSPPNLRTYLLLGISIELVIIAILIVFRKFMS
ncbi:MAG: hypothetical protein ACFFEK_11280 [Candidatus Thorarchaeota archaeon]